VPVTVAPPPAGEIDAGVIEEARRRQRRRRLGLSAVLAAVVAALAGLALGSGGGGHGGGAVSRPAERLFRQRPLHLTFVDGRPYANGQPFALSVSPSLQAGNVGLCVMKEGGGSCNGPYAGAGIPLFGEEGWSPEARVGRDGEIDFTLTGPNVAAVRVRGIGTLRPVPLPGLPVGDKAVVFYRPPGSIGTVLPPGATTQLLHGEEHNPDPVGITLTPLDGAGQAIPTIPIESRGRMFLLPNSYWQSPASAPADASCALASTLANVSVEWGQVATDIAPDPAVAGTAFFTCMQVWYHHDGTAFQAALLLNARQPGRAPGALWNARALPGHPGIVQVSAFYGRRPTAAQLAALRREDPTAVARAELAERPIAPATLARREGDALLLVRYGRDLAERIAFLQSLHVTRIALPPSRG
jgi:hypothetical protein